VAQESPDHTLQATALVHEAYMRLVDVANPEPWNGRGHFFAAAAEAMRRILIESARRRQSQKLGGDLNRVDFDQAQSLAKVPAGRPLHPWRTLSVVALNLNRTFNLHPGSRTLPTANATGLRPRCSERFARISLR
jgi:hypothetical protein